MELAEAPAALMQACQEELQDQVSPEYLQCQIEVGTGVCNNIAAARDDLRRLRGTVARLAAVHGLAPIAAACHPLADWKKQHHTDKDRYNRLSEDLAAVSQRMLICGMHVHVGIPDKDMRIDLVNQLGYFLPHLLALSTSSPYWNAVDTGLASYRLTVVDGMPRSGLPPRFESWSDYARSVHVLTDLGIIEDSSKIWWDLRPSARFPTIEARICDVTPRLNHALSIAALIQCITRLLWRLARRNQRWRIYDSFLVAENRWRAQRYGIHEGLIDFGAHAIVPLPVLLDELIGLVTEDAEALGCLAEIEAARDIIASGSSADRQRAVYRQATEGGKEHAAALRAVVASLVAEFHADL
jgi:glutamate---cysteine ligase / carboxylate-amine ligase